MRKNFKLRIMADRRGKITSGTKTLSSSGKEIPKSLNYFNIEKFPELEHLYGNKPDKLYVMFINDNITSWFQDEYVLWAQSKSKASWKKRSCDGEVCHHHVQETLMVDGEKITFKAGDEHECFHCGSDDCSLDPASQCRCYTGFSAFVLNPHTGRVIIPRTYRFQTNSVNSSDRIQSELYSIRDAFGTVAKIPFALSVDMIEQQTADGKKNKFPLWDLQVWGTVDAINLMVDQKRIPVREDESLAIEGESVKQIEQPKKVENKGPENRVEKNDSGDDAYDDMSQPTVFPEFLEDDEEAPPPPPKKEKKSKKLVKCSQCGTQFQPEILKKNLDEQGYVVDAGYCSVLCYNKGTTDDKPKDQSPPTEESPLPDEAYIPDETPASTPPHTDILYRRGVLKGKKPIDLTDHEYVIAVCVKMLMQLSKGVKSGAREKLHEFTTDNKRGWVGVSASADIPRKQDRINELWERTQKAYRDLLYKEEQRESQTGLPL